MTGSTSDGRSRPIISAWDISQYYYCKRKIYFLKVLGVPAPARRKMEYGREVDEAEGRLMLRRPSIYGFKRDDVAEVLEKLHVVDEHLGLKGEIDQTLILKTGEVIPVDVKYTGTLTVQRHHRKQLTAYAILLDKHFNTNVRRAVVRFARQRRNVQIAITWEDKRSLIAELENIRSLLRSERIPRPAAPGKCGYCEVRKYCEAYGNN